jgi:Tol biopolymer transport system component
MRLTIQLATSCLALVAATCALPAADAGTAPSGVVDGQILYATQDPTVGDTVPFAANPDGSHARQVSASPMGCARWSPDGSEIANGCNDGVTKILVVDTGELRILPPVGEVGAGCGVWSSDGSRLACEGLNEDNGAHNGILTVRVRDWSDVQRVTLNPDGDDVPGDYAPNSRQLVFLRDFPGDDLNNALYRVNTNGTGLVRLTRPDLAVVSTGSWSPSGNAVLFSAVAEDGHRQRIFEMHADGSGLRPVNVEGINCGGARTDPTSAGCADPVWSPSGRQIAFRMNTTDSSVVERADADGSNPSFVADLGFDPSDFVDWGVHPLAN